MPRRPLRRQGCGSRDIRWLPLVCAVLIAVVVQHGRADADAEVGDLHLSSLEHFLGAQRPLRHEVLLIGDGEAMRFWPMWPFYQYVASFGRLSPASDAQGARQGAVAQAAGMVTLITPNTRGFRRGMPCDEAVATFAHTAEPLLYFLVSPGDQPLLLAGVREYPGATVLEVEDMEGEHRLLHLIRSNRIDFVVYRYLSSELLVLQEGCPFTTFLHLPFFIDSGHFHVRPPPAPAPAREIDILIYGNTWSHRYPLRHRVLRALTGGHVAHTLSFKVVPHPGYNAAAQAKLRGEDWTRVLCQDVPPAFWREAAGPGALASAPQCCLREDCVLADCEAAAELVANGPLASCDDVHTCPGGSAWKGRTSESDDADAAGWLEGVGWRELKRKVERCAPVVRGRALGRLLRAAKIAVADAIQGVTVYGSDLQHSYLVAKYHEIAACGTVIAGNVPLSGHASALAPAVVDVSEEEDDAAIVAALQGALRPADALHASLRIHICLYLGVQVPCVLPTHCRPVPLLGSAISRNRPMHTVFATGRRCSRRPWRPGR